MTTALEKSHLLTAAISLGERGSGNGGPPKDEVGDLLHAYYRHVAVEDVVDRSAEELYGALVSHYRTADVRPQGTASVHVFTPTLAEHGWAAGGHSVVEFFTDHMPFLVDSVVMELTRQQRDVHLVIHPQFDVTRDVAGNLGEIACPDSESSEPPEGAERESWMHIEISRVGHDEDVEEIASHLQRVLRDVRESVEDWPRMRQQVTEIVAELRAEPPPTISTEELESGLAFLEWLGDDHFTFLGYREYRLDQEGSDEYLRARPGTGFGILRDDPDLTASAKLPPKAAGLAREHTLLVLAKANSRATVHRPAYLDYVGVKMFDEAGEVIGERRFLGLFSSAAYTESVWHVPLLREKAKDVLRTVGFDPHSHAGKALIDTLETYPRDELFHTPVDELATMATRVMETRGRRQLRIFVRRDTYGRYVSVLVFLPRDRYNTTVRERFSEILKESFDGESIEFTVRMSESTTARVHFVVRPPRGQKIPDVDVSDLERRLTDASRSWRDDFTAATIAEFGEDVGSRLARTFQGAFPEAYKEDFSAATGALDLARLEALGDRGTDLSLFSPLDAARGEARLKVFRRGASISLSEVLPALSSMGVEVVDERPYQLDHVEHPSYIYEFGLRYPPGMPDRVREPFQDTIRAVWDGYNEIDGFNALVLAAGITWRQATVLRAYAKYMKQGNSPFAVDYLEEALRGNTDITRLLVELFEARFDPGRNGLAADAEARKARSEEITQRIERALDDVASLDHDRILRSYLTHINATLRTNYFQPGSQGPHHTYMSFKLEPSAIPDLPAPRPKFEIFVYSPRVEGVHLRFGAVARGGLRWSDRRDDFRTEVLGLVKAQMVKNTVIVPVGAKGGFFCKQLPDPGQREAWMTEGIACYKTFISGLLDITDNVVSGETVPPPRVVRHDGDDSYLVVAADKGTATFSDIANGVAKDYGFWLGDAFASGGSVGYDHKVMGITARGAWESVRRHFREMGVDCQSEDFTCVGVGDMSGDVFGNGMLLSEHIRLVAAFDHRDIFLDPDPVADTSDAERRRLFDLPRSSWQDYDQSLISEGGGVFPRSLKAIPISPQVRAALSLADSVRSLTPAELMRAILLAEVDLLWNGGIGTYVKSATETHADVGDKANDVIRVDGASLRCRCVGEGGNLGLTQRGRIEYARTGCDGKGGRINTDFIDNSAGVDTSDHEVNIKILLDRVVAGGDLTEKQRNDLLASMTDEVGTLVLRDNYEQNHALANAAIQAPQLLHVHEDWIRRLERQGLLDRALEALPSRQEVAARLERKEGLTVPELSVLLAYTKIVLADELIGTDLADDPFLRNDLFCYFPSKMRQTYRERMESHPLRREIIVTQAVNDLVNGAGMTFFHRLSEETAASSQELVRANFVAREIFGSRSLIDEINSFDNVLDAAVQTRMRLEMRTLVERASRWLINNRRPPLDSEATVDFFGVVAQQVVSALPELMTGREATAMAARRDALVSQGVPEELAVQVAVLPPASVVLNVVETAKRDERDPLEVARVHFALGERLGLSALLASILALPRDDRWQTMARAALRDDLHAVRAPLPGLVLRRPGPSQPVPVRSADWEEGDTVVVSRAATTLLEICGDDHADLARLSVGLRVVRTLLATP